MAEQTVAKPEMRKPVFKKVDQLKPGTSGHTLTVKVVSSTVVLQKGRPASQQQLRQTSIAECLVGDETGTILFTARNEQGMNSLSLSLSLSLFLVVFRHVFSLCNSQAEMHTGCANDMSFSHNESCSATWHLVLSIMLSDLDLALTPFCLVPVDLMKPDTTVILRNAKIDMFKGSMRLAVDKWGRVEVTNPADFVVKEDNNLSLVEYELVNVAA
ncbi:hypothetical protein BVC80_1183g25 [Macleaya cordata]|uniref:Single-stranded DNA binding protein Ssb-like OB fold domain-containing protein n=1 Tax=Macleaya cordata TaxID=56857 RepID=A0A200PQ79_MACCD|nr:hypothetical protein BVC80_1183g25 [Macleaya cordata]